MRKIVVLQLPNRGTNRDWVSLMAQPHISFEWIRPEDYKADADLLVLPGSGRSIEDYLVLRSAGGEQLIRAHLAAGKPLLGICGGMQMLLDEMHDPLLTQGDSLYVKALGLIPGSTVFGPAMISTNVKAELMINGVAAMVQGVEHRSGYTTFLDDPRFDRLARVVKRDFDDGEKPEPSRLDLISGGSCPTTTEWAPGCERYDGSVSSDRKIWVSYIHLLATNPSFLSVFLPIVLP